MAGHAVEAVEISKSLLRQLLERARITKNATTIEPPLAKSSFTDLLDRIGRVLPGDKSQLSKKGSQYAILETATTDIFNELLSSSNIDRPEFVHVWNLLDLVSILSDDEECDPALLFWLIEELLDSQTISGCRKIFDYLESRRERITAKHFGSKTLVILRSCNELLRRLSRAEDTAFCGRVFIFMFQSFPLGDKSSVNLRGEYHVENVTTYDKLAPTEENVSEAMEVDSETKSAPTGPAADAKVIPNGPAGDAKTTLRSVTFDKVKKTAESEKPLDPDTLYPIFWSLQQSFSQPKKLFDAAHFATFKKGLDATMVMFKSVQNEYSGRGPAKSSEEDKRGTKRKRGQEDDDLANTFNPKYLTSRDLFELEISDLSFRRHILVQTLIIMDFLLSLSPKAKEKLATVTKTNSSVTYEKQILGEEDIKWAIEMKRSIADYLKQAYEGPFFYRMVETVLSRDKNWVRWKIESCPAIERPAISPEDYISAKNVARRATKNKNLRPKALGSLDLEFLAEVEGLGSLEKLKNPSKYDVPSIESFKNKIAIDELEIEMPTNEETKQAAIEAKASKGWRALRIASKTKLAFFDKIDDPEKIDVIFLDDPAEVDSVKENGHEPVDDESQQFPDDRRSIVVTGHRRFNGALMRRLEHKHPSIFSRATCLTTLAPPPDEGEINSIPYEYVTAETFNVMRDGDQLLEFTNDNGIDYGTSRKVVEGIVASGKIPIIGIDHRSIQQLKDQAYTSRFIILSPSVEELERRLRFEGTEESNEEIQRLVQLVVEQNRDTEEAALDDYKVIDNDDVEQALIELEGYIFQNGSEEVIETMPDMGEMKDGGIKSDEKDVPMDDASVSATVHESPLRLGGE